MNQNGFESAEQPKWRSAQVEFTSEKEVIKFLQDFWQHVGSPRLAQILSATSVSELVEETALDRTRLQDLGGGSFRVVIYRNHDTRPLTDPAIDFLKLRGITGE